MMVLYKAIWILFRPKVGDDDRQVHEWKLGEVELQVFYNIFLILHRTENCLESDIGS